MIKEVNFGQYRHKNSLIHLLDPRLKILSVVFLSILMFTVKVSEILLFTISILFLLFLSRIKIIELLSGLRIFYSFMAFILLMYLLFSREKIDEAFMVIWRFLMLLLISYSLTHTTSVSMLIAAIESLAVPLKIFGLKPRNIAILLSITIRFIPVMFIHASQSMDSINSRLGSMKKARVIKVFIISLLDRLFKSASTLSDAMFSRNYNEDAKSHIILKIRGYDYVSMAALAAFSVLLTIY